jgi:hypothetical protein
MRKLFIVFTILCFMPEVKAALNCPVDTANKFDSHVKIIRKVPGDEFYCTGTIVNRCFVLTAAHCLNMGSKDKKVFGSPSEFSFKTGVHSEVDLGSATEVIPYPGYNEDDVDKRKKDVGILRLAKCQDKSLEIDYSGMTTDTEVTVGGYGAITLRGWKFQPTRRIGTTNIKRISQELICTTGATVEADGVTVRNSSNCLPVGQDSGSPLIQNGKIRGIFVDSTEIWKTDGSTTITESCSMNLRNPPIKEFIEEVLSRTGSGPTQSKIQDRSIGVK